MFLPVYDKFNYFKGFVTSIIRHDGLYGQGEEKVFNMQTFLHNIPVMIQYNIIFSILLAVVLVVVIYMFFKPEFRKKHPKEYVFFLTLFLVSLLGILMIAKHYKNYYVIPIIGLSGFIYFLLTRLLKQWVKFRYLNLVIVLVLIFFIAYPASDLYKPYAVKKIQYNSNMQTASWINQNIAPIDYFFIEPTWVSGPMIENGLIYGTTYVGYKHYFYNEYEKFYPNTLTWNNRLNPMKYFGLIDANNEAVLKSGKNIYLLSTPMRNTNLLINYLDSCSKELGINLKRETVYSNMSKGEFIYKYSHIDNWHTESEGRCGFERVNGNNVLSDDERISLAGPFTLSDQEVCNGNWSLQLDTAHRFSPMFMINHVVKGDFIEATVKRRVGGDREKSVLVLASPNAKQDSLFIMSWKPLSRISSDWELIRLDVRVAHQPADSIVACYVNYSGDEAEYFDDLTYRHLSPRKK